MEIIRTAQRWIDLVEVIRQEIYLCSNAAAQTLGGVCVTGVMAATPSDSMRAIRVRSEQASKKLIEAFELSELATSIRLELAKLRFRYGVNDAVIQQQDLVGRIKLLTNILSSNNAELITFEQFESGASLESISDATIDVLAAEKRVELENVMIELKGQYQSLEDKMHSVLSRKVKIEIPEKFLKILGLSEISAE